ncbi:MAG: hypothetical protein Kow0069_05000 [Promethearchaeota archaeon]
MKVSAFEMVDEVLSEGRSALEAGDLRTASDSLERATRQIRDLGFPPRLKSQLEGELMSLRDALGRASAWREFEVSRERLRKGDPVGDPREVLESSKALGTAASILYKLGEIDDEGYRRVLADSKKAERRALARLRRGGSREEGAGGTKARKRRSGVRKGSGKQRNRRGARPRSRPREGTITPTGDVGDRPRPALVPLRGLELGAALGLPDWMWCDAPGTFLKADLGGLLGRRKGGVLALFRFHPSTPVDVGDPRVTILLLKRAPPGASVVVDRQGRCEVVSVSAGALATGDSGTPSADGSSWRERYLETCWELKEARRGVVEAIQSGRAHDLLERMLGTEVEIVGGPLSGRPLAFVSGDRLVRFTVLAVVVTSAPTANLVDPGFFFAHDGEGTYHVPHFMLGRFLRYVDRRRAAWFVDGTGTTALNRFRELSRSAPVSWVAAASLACLGGVLAILLPPAPARWSLIGSIAGGLIVLLAGALAWWGGARPLAGAWEREFSFPGFPGLPGRREVLPAAWLKELEGRASSRPATLMQALSDVLPWEVARRAVEEVAGWTSADDATTHPFLVVLGKVMRSAAPTRDAYDSMASQARVLPPVPSLAAHHALCVWAANALAERGGSPDLPHVDVDDERYLEKLAIALSKLAPELVPSPSAFIRQARAAQLEFETKSPTGRGAVREHLLVCQRAVRSLAEALGARTGDNLDPSLASDATPEGHATRSLDLEGELDEAAAESPVIRDFLDCD